MGKFREADGGSTGNDPTEDVNFPVVTASIET